MLNAFPLSHLLTLSLCPLSPPTKVEIPHFTIQPAAIFYIISVSFIFYILFFISKSYCPTMAIGNSKN